MLSKLIRAMVGAAVVVLPGLALADDATVPAQSLATVEAILQYCAKVVPDAAGQFTAKARMIAGTADEEALAKVRAGDDYRSVYDTTLDAISKVGKEDVQKACGQYVAQSEQ